MYFIALLLQLCLIYIFGNFIWWVPYKLCGTKLFSNKNAKSNLQLIRLSSNIYIYILLLLLLLLLLSLLLLHPFFLNIHLNDVTWLYLKNSQAFQCWWQTHVLANNFFYIYCKNEFLSLATLRPMKQLSLKCQTVFYAVFSTLDIQFFSIIIPLFWLLYSKNYYCVIDCKFKSVTIHCTNGNKIIVCLPWTCCHVQVQTAKLHITGISRNTCEWSGGWRSYM